MSKITTTPDAYTVRKNLLRFGLPENFKFLIITGTSGSGKTTIVEKICNMFLNILKKSITYTTRQAREKETHGVDYYFIKVSEFLDKIRNSDFIEHEEVYKNIFYGTSALEFRQLTDRGLKIVHVCDVKGALKLQEIFGDRVKVLFLDAVDSVDAGNFGTNGIYLNTTLRKRLSERKDSTPQKDAERLFAASNERITCKVNRWQLINNIGHIDDSIFAIKLILHEFFGIEPNKAK